MTLELGWPGVVKMNYVGGKGVSGDGWRKKGRKYLPRLPVSYVRNWGESQLVCVLIIISLCSEILIDPQSVCLFVLKPSKFYFK